MHVTVLEEVIPVGYDIETRIVGPGLLTTRAVTKKTESGRSYILADYLPWDDKVVIANYEAGCRLEHVEFLCGPLDSLLIALRDAHNKIEPSKRYNVWAALGI